MWKYGVCITSLLDFSVFIREKRFIIKDIEITNLFNNRFRVKKRCNSFVLNNKYMLSLFELNN